MAKEKCECCCGNEEVKMYFCPRCKSKKVKPIQGWRNAFGIIPKWLCDSCGYENMAFPILVINKNTKNKTNKKRRQNGRRK